MERVEAYRDGVAGVKQSLSAMVYRIRTDRTKQSVKSWAQTVLGAAGLDGRDHPSVRQQAQALLDALRARARYWPDPTGVEYVGTAEATLCLAPGNCTNGGDCDDLTVAFCSAAASVDIPCAIIHQKFGAGQQEHVLAAVQDERGRWLYADPTLKDAPVGERAPGVTWEQRIDPFEAVSFAGIAEATPSIVTFGRAPSGDTMMKFHNGHWWAWNGQEWLLHQNNQWRRFAHIFAGVGDIVTPNAGPEVATQVAANEIEQARWTLQEKITDLSATVQSYVNMRRALGASAFDQDQAAVAGPSEFLRGADGQIVWTSAVVEYAEWLIKFGENALRIAEAAASGSRAVAFDDVGRLLVQALPTDVSRYLLHDDGSITVTDAQGNVTGSVATNGDRSRAGAVGTGAVPVVLVGIAIVGAVLIAIAAYYAISKLCEMLIVLIREKADTHIGDLCAKQNRPPEECIKALNAARAAVIKAETEKEKTDPFAHVADTAASALNTVLVIGMVGAAIYVGKIAYDEIKSTRARKPA